MPQLATVTGFVRDRGTSLRCGDPLTPQQSSRLVVAEPAPSHMPQQEAWCASIARIDSSPVLPRSPLQCSRSAGALNTPPAPTAITTQEQDSSSGSATPRVQVPSMSSQEAIRRAMLHDEVTGLRSEAAEWHKAQQQREADLVTGLREALSEKGAAERKLAAAELRIAELEGSRSEDSIASDGTSVSKSEWASRSADAERERDIFKWRWEEAEHELRRAERECAALQARQAMQGELRSSIPGSTAGGGVSSIRGRRPLQGRTLQSTGSVKRPSHGLVGTDLKSVNDGCVTRGRRPAQGQPASPG